MHFKQSSRHAGVPQLTSHIRYGWHIAHAQANEVSGIEGKYDISIL